MPFELGEASGRAVLYTEDKQGFLPEELLGMSLYDVARMGSIYAKSNISACVVAVPGHMSAQVSRRPQCVLCAVCWPCASCAAVRAVC